MFFLKKLTSIFSRSLVQILLYFNHFISAKKTISKQDLLNFFKKIEPIETGRPLTRLGNNFDGGYLIPNDLSNLTKCFTIGVGNDISFEDDLLKKGINSYFADGTVDCLPMQSKNFTFIKKNISITNSDKYITINDFIKNGLKNSSEDFILKIDIEGAEYRNIQHLEENFLIQARILVVEFHYMQRILSGLYFSNVIEPTFAKILKTHSVVHIHPNNDSGFYIYNKKKIFKTLEITFLRNDRIIKKQKKLQYSSQLDRPTNPKKKELIIPENYFN